jgi:hypothetical protein
MGKCFWSRFVFVSFPKTRSNWIWDVNDKSRCKLDTSVYDGIDILEIS